MFHSLHVRPTRCATAPLLALLLCVVAVPVLAVAAATGPQATDAGAGRAEPQVLAILARHPLPRVYSAGQPDPADWTAIAAYGVTTVIDLRPDAERPGRDEAAEVRRAGLAYRQIPVAAAQDLDFEAAHALWDEIESSPGPVLLHCASGNRAGALLALAAVHDGGMAPEQALTLGREAGMTGTEPRVRELLGLPLEPPANTHP
jgi:uncharacterized protein (TIGR01244 family)